MIAIYNLQVVTSECVPGQSVIVGPFDQDFYAGRLNKYTFTAFINEEKYSLSVVCKLGQPNKPLVVGFPGYLSNPEGHLVFYGAMQFIDSLSDYTIITINDREGNGRDGSWYLGKQLDCGLFSYQILINLAVNFFKNELSPSKTLFFGTSMGGFGALMHSTTCSVDETYICVPQSSLDPSYHYFRRSTENYSLEREPFTVSPHLKALSLETDEKFKSCLKKNPFLDINHLGKFIKSGGSEDINDLFGGVQFSGYYHLLASRYDHPQDEDGVYFSQQILPILNTFSDCNVRFSSAILPFPTHDCYLYVDNVCGYSDIILPSVPIVGPSQTLRTSANQAITQPPFWRPFMTQYT